MFEVRVKRGLNDGHGELVLVSEAGFLARLKGIWVRGNGFMWQLAAWQYDSMTHMNGGLQVGRDYNLILRCFSGCAGGGWLETRVLEVCGSFPACDFQRFPQGRWCGAVSVRQLQVRRAGQRLRGSPGRGGQ